jgi:hypothetical protein
MTDVTVASCVGPVGPNVGAAVVVAVGGVDGGGGLVEASAALGDARVEGPVVRFEIAPRPRSTATPTVA